MAILSRPQESGAHWYTLDGKSAHSTPKADGSGDRKTTLGDAKKKKLLPSVTGILGVLDKPALATWKAQQVALAALRNPKTPDESDEYWCTRVVNASHEPTAEAADLGTRIHAALDLSMDGQPYADDLRPYVEPVLAWRNEVGISITHREVVLVNPSEGFAGCVDVLFKWGASGRGILDYKTRKTKPGQKVDPYDGQAAQLAAYAATHYGTNTLPKVLAANVFISTTEPGRIEVVKHSDLAAHYEFFLHCCAIWRYTRGYDPRQKPEPSDTRRQDLFDRAINGDGQARADLYREFGE